MGTYKGNGQVYRYLWPHSEARRTIGTEELMGQDGQGTRTAGK